MKRFLPIIVLTVASASIILFIGAVENVMYPIRYKKLIKTYSAENGLDAALVASIIYAESRYNKNALSNKGAMGLMQLTKPTAEAFSDGGNFDLFDPETNIKIGCKYLRYLFGKYHTTDVVLACYNAGETAARQWLSADGRLKKRKISFPETQKYLKTIENVYERYKLKM